MVSLLLPSVHCSLPNQLVGCGNETDGWVRGAIRVEFLQVGDQLIGIKYYRVVLVFVVAVKPSQDNSDFVSVRGQKLLTSHHRQINNHSVGSRWEPEDQQGADNQLQRPPALRASEAFHSITSSAMASSPGGKLRPNALAVLRLITNSNLIDCMTGRSAGFSPLRIRPVYTPAWRCASLGFVP